MSQITPTSLCSEQLESQVNGVNNSGNTDILHFISNGEIVSWIDYDGFPGGNLNTGGGGGGGGVTSINSETGDITVSSGSGIAVNNFGKTIEIINTASSANLPWVDIQSFGAKPFQVSVPQQRAFATTASPNSSLVGLTSPIFTNGQGLVIWAGGNPTSQSTPSAPTAVATTVTGTQNLNYKVVGVDVLGGLTAASTAVQVTNAPNVFGNLSVPISGITGSSASGGTITVNFSSPINATIGNTIHITGITGAGSTWNGVWIINQVLTASQVTYLLSGAISATGTIGAHSYGRLSNVQPISSISRAANGVITITTPVNSNYVAAAGSSNPPIAIIENCSPADLNGQYVIDSVSNTTITCLSGQFSAVSGTVTVGSSTVTCYEYVYITCPAYGPNTLAYYIYSDSANPGGAFNLIGKTMPFERGFKDYGPTLMQGYTAPGYVPTTASASSQNQLYGGTVTSGGGTFFITVTPAVPAQVTTATALLDDGQALIAAIAAARIGNSQYSPVILSPPQTPGNFPSYVINYPVTIPVNQTLMIGCRVILNETMTFAGSNNLYSPFGSAYNSAPQFGIGNYATITGLASPLVYLSGTQILVQGIGFYPGSGLTANVNQQNGQYGMISQNGKQIFRDCMFGSGPSSTAVPCVFNSNVNGSSSIAMQDCQFEGNTIFGTASVVGQSAQGPAIGNLLLHCTDSGNGSPVAQFSLYGNCSFSGRGILLDNRNYQTSTTSGYQFGGLGVIEFQSPQTASVMCWGPIFGGVSVIGWLNDSAQGALVANWTSIELAGLTVSGSTSGNASLLTGNFAYFYSPGVPVGLSGTDTAIIGQNQNLLLDTGAASFTTTGTSSDTLTIYGVQAASQIIVAPTNALAATDVAAGNVYVSSKSANTVVIAHGTTATMTFDVVAILY